MVGRVDTQVGPCAGERAEENVLHDVTEAKEKLTLGCRQHAFSRKLEREAAQRGAQSEPRGNLQGTVNVYGVDWEMESGG